MAGLQGPPAGRCSTCGLAGPWLLPSCLESSRTANGSTVEAECPREPCRLQGESRRSADTTPGAGPSFNVATAARAGTEGRRRNREPNPEISMALGRAASGERRLGAAAVLAVLSALLLAGATCPPPLAGNVGREGGGVTVINVPPQFSGFRIRTQDGLNYIDVVVSDYNSWSDIFRVEVAIENDLQAPVADVTFQQYPDNATLQRQPQFAEPVGSFLVRSLSSATYSATGQSIPERTEMRVTFVMSPVNGKWLSVTATDLGGLTAFAQVEYSPGFLGRLPMINGWLLMTIALTFSVALVAVRIRRDRIRE